MALQEVSGLDSSQLGFSQPPEGGLFLPNHDPGLAQRGHRVLRVLQVGSLGDQDVAEINTQMAEHNDAWELVISRPPLVSAEREGALLGDYQVDDPRQTRIILPKGSVTGSSLLRGHVSGSKYNPMLDLRIKTSRDKPIVGFSSPSEGPREIVERPSDGSWFRFRLPFVRVALIETPPEATKL